jgi:hypothetical protein
MIKFCHISPIIGLEKYAQYNGAHLILAHLVEQSEEYRNFYKNLDDGKPKIMDNSAFEMYKQGREMYSSDKLVEIGKKVDADYIVMSDYPNEPGEKTIKSAERLIPELKKEGFKTFFVPQSKINNLEDYINTIVYGINNSDIDLIGISILGAPNALGVEKNNNLQRYLSRYHIMNILDELGELKEKSLKKFHFLGMVDGPNEISLVKDFHKYIYSWDSSSAIWAGMNSIRYDNSPTGLINGKFEKEVDFFFKKEYNDEDVLYNINHINKLIKGV